MIVVRPILLTEVVAVAQVMVVAVIQDLSFPLQVGRVVSFD
jgi:hypothetical protein